jgi:AhpD family alkylhydroperoxidase
MAMAISGVNGCDYCIAAHSHVATTFTKSSQNELALNRRGSSSDPKRAVAIGFAKSLVEKRGKVTDEELDTVRGAAYTDQQTLEMVSFSVQFQFTNFLNNVAKIYIDIPDIVAANAK